MERCVWCSKGKSTQKHTSQNFLYIKKKIHVENSELHSTNSLRKLHEKIVLDWNFFHFWKWHFSQQFVCLSSRFWVPVVTEVFCLEVIFCFLVSTSHMYIYYWDWLFARFEYVWGVAVCERCRRDWRCATSELHLASQNGWKLCSRIYACWWRWKFRTGTRFCGRTQNEKLCCFLFLTNRKCFFLFADSWRTRRIFSHSSFEEPKDARGFRQTFITGCLLNAFDSHREI